MCEAPSTSGKNYRWAATCD